jgi:lipopolysaccharide export system protein LptA
VPVPPGRKFVKIVVDNFASVQYSGNRLSAHPLMRSAGVPVASCSSGSSHTRSGLAPPWHLGRSLYSSAFDPYRLRTEFQEDIMVRFSMVRFFLFSVCVLSLLTAARPADAQQLRADSLKQTATLVVVTKRHQVYRGNARLILPDCMLVADRFDVYSTDKTQERLSATGHVRLVVKKASPLTSFMLVAQRADYDATKNEISLVGDVRFTKGESGFVQGMDKAVIGQALTATARTVTYRSTEKTIGTTLDYTLDDPSVHCFWPLDQDPTLEKALLDAEKR